MKLSDLNHLVVDWKNSIETGDRPKCKMLASKLSFYFSATKNITGEQRAVIEKKAAEVFALLNAPQLDHFTERVLEMIGASMLLIEDRKTITDKQLYQESSQCTVGAMYCLQELSEVLKRSFPHICHLVEKEPDDNFQKILARQGEYYHVEEGALRTFCEFGAERLEHIKELEEALFAPPELLKKELCLEHIAFDPAHPDQTTLTLRESKQIVLDCLSSAEKEMIEDKDIVVFLAAARLYLQRFYEAYPEMILPREINLREVASENIPEEYLNESQLIEIDYGKHLKIVSLWVAIKALAEIRVKPQTFIHALIPKVLEKDFVRDGGINNLKDWLLSMEKEFLKAISYDTSFEGLPLARVYLDEISQEIAQEK